MNAPIHDTALISISATPAAIAFNYEETRAWLEQELQQYDIVVTAETLAGSKKLATELNKLAAEISKRRKEAVAEVSAPIKDFDDKAKSLEQMCKDGRQRVLDQVKVFEDETRAQVLRVLVDERAAAWEALGVADEFRQSIVDDLVKLTGLTKTGKLSAALSNELNSRVQADKQLQQQTEMRLLHLENQSYKAGLAAPLSRAHVETFLFAPDDEYDQRLSALLDSERERERIAEERTRQRMAAEQRRAEEEAQRRAAVEVVTPEPEPVRQAHEPESTVQTPATEETAAEETFAFGALSDPAAAKVVKATAAQIEQAAIETSEEAPLTPIGIWQPAGLIAIVFNATVYRKD